MTERNRRPFIRRAVIETHDSNVPADAVGGTAGHDMAVRDEASHGINDIRFILDLYPGGNANVQSSSDLSRPLYPESPDQFTEVEIPEAAFEALRKFKKAKTYNLSIEQRLEHMKVMVQDLAEAHDITAPTLSMENCTEANRNVAGISGSSNYNPAIHHITMVGKLSIITLLHEFGHALTSVRDEYFACGYSTELFKAVYPDQFARLNYNGHMALQR